MTKLDYTILAFAAYLLAMCGLAISNESAIDDALTIRAGVHMVGE